MTMRARFTALLTAAVLLFSLTACDLLSLLPAGEEPDPPEESEPVPAQTSQPEKEPNPFALAWDPGDSLHPLRAGTTNQTLAPLVFEGLYALDDAFAAQPALCAHSMRSGNGLSWTFTLREDVTFSDGTPLTAQHAADALNAARVSDLYRSRLAGITRVTARDGAVTVELSAPNGALPALLDIPIALETEESAYPLGTGPYRFAEGAGGLCLTASPTWRGGDVLPLEDIPLRETTSADDRIAAFDTGLVTLVDTDLTGTSALGYSGNYETWDYPTATMLYLGFNAKTGFCKDAALRQAIARGIDRTAVTESFLSGHADPTPLPVSPCSTFYDEALAGEAGYDLNDAVQLLADHGYTLNDGLLYSGRKQVTLTLLVNNENSFKTGLADHIASELAKLGITVAVSKVGWDAFEAALDKGNFDLYLGQVRLSASFDPSPLLTGVLNYGKFASKEINDLLAAFCAAAGEERETAASALYARLVDEAPFAPLCFQHRSILTQWGSVSGLTPIQSDPFYGMEHWKLA